MRKLLQAAGLALAVALTWFAIWHTMMSADVARVKASIDYQYQALRATNRTMSIKADKVYATGFPFKFLIAVERPTLSMVDGTETFAVSVPKLTLSAANAELGRYQVNLPNTIEALYAKDGAAPEHYTVNPVGVDGWPALYFSAEKGGMPCGPLTGKACEAVPADAPLISYGLALPKSITLHMGLNGETRDVSFQMMAIPVPVIQPIPADMSRPLQLAVGVLREALVFKTPDTPGN